ncbi:hypothetical protein EPUS_03493 [Endocarpon pusillum Z07020]|uniref:Condensin complex subunit 2 n=1 Tax=Endocarpon pusillum (strain Z07020 / HMAS-L-300199) TaxID=1263415 RepID=U1HQH1_ENDPU|nr:uncharacterized protein EPUS_03493 [Endocarpon pusillum Z07020]ERF71339.1 hypothetical protein EPUS_03493 [Endocarpon pusillum Z07020]
MPRVANQPTGKSRTATQQTLATPQNTSPVKLLLNDDRTEKAARLQSRQALHDIQMNQIRAAASPMRKMNAHENKRAASSSPQTPRSAAALARDRDRGKGKGNNDPPGSPGMLDVVSHSAVTPMKRVPILANFEEWMKMATDNKINAANSWNFALIDYFHDLSLLKEGDGVNFQKASCTLDGCVKIYTSRVDSVASETGKLLSGLADSGAGKKAKERAEGEEGGSGDEEEEEEEEGEDGVRKKAKKKTQRSHEQTLAPTFASLQLKKLELEFTVDPLFKKASADFDEGGAKGLLLNHLSIDSEGRIVFDSSDETADTKSYPNTTQMQQTLVDPSAPPTEELSNLSLLPDNQPQNQEIDLASLASKFFPDLSILDSQDICPSMKSFTLGDATADLNLPFLKAPEDWRESHQANGTDRSSIDIPIYDKSGIFIDSENAAGFDEDDDDSPLVGFDMGPDVGFGEGGEAWAKDAALEPMLRVARAEEIDRDGGEDGLVIGDFDPANPNTDAYAVGLNHQRRVGDSNSGDPTENILSYFDAALKSTKGKAAAWAGPEHWRIRKIKAAQASSENPPAPRVRKEKREPFEIDFLTPMDQGLAEMLYTPAASNAAISLPKAQWKTKGRNLLPDDRHFNSRSLLQLWLKPKARVGRRRAVPGLPDRGARGGSSEELGMGGDMDGHVEMDEAYWAKRREEAEERRRREVEEEKDRKEGDYDANFFADDGAALPFGDGIPDGVDDDDDDGAPGFTDAREMLSPPLTADSQHQSAPFGMASSSQQQIPTESHLLPGSFGSQLVTQGGRRLRPEYVNYARVAKKVDVRRLKENMWRGMSQRLMSAISSSAPAPVETVSPDDAANAPPTPAPTDPGLDADGDVDMDMDMDMDVHASDREMEVAEMAKAGTHQTKEGGELLFTHLIRDLKSVYPEQQMRDISTSYCFICLLHLANEKGLILEGDYGQAVQNMAGGAGGEGMDVMTGLMREIRVRRDESVGVGYVGE